MAAPSGIVWGSVVGGYGRIGIYSSVTSTNTQTTVKAEVWFWSKYSVSDSGNTLYYDILDTAGSATTSKGAVAISTSVASGSGWSTSNQQRIGSYTHTYSRAKGPVTKYLRAKLINIDRVGGTMTAASAVTIPQLPWYEITYNMNGGSGESWSQQKWYGEDAKIVTTKPTRTGYTFLGWNTNASAAAASSTYAPGATYSTNAALTLYAIWKANTYSVKYNANGGTGAPLTQTKTYGEPLTLSRTIPTRTNYNFLGWGISANATVHVYGPGSTYSNDTAITLYAVWELAYVKPRIVNLSLSRCDADGTLNDSGTNALVSFDWGCDKANPSIKIEWALVGDAASGSSTISATGTTATTSHIVGSNSLDPETSYDIIVTVTDSGGSSFVYGTLSSMRYTIDYLYGGKGVAFGKAAELDNTAEFEFDAQFNGAVRGNVPGMNRLPEIPANSDFNSYMETGCYAVYGNSVAATIANIPVVRAGRLEVWSSTGEGIRGEQWSYLRQRYIPYNSANAVWERDLARGEDNVWVYYDWWISSLTPSASEKVYSKAAMTLALSANKTLGTVNAYTKIPLDTNVLSTNSRLTLSDNSIRIGSNIQYVKVSGVALLKCGSSAGNRHMRIQKISNGVTTSYSWACVYGVAASNTEYVLPPMIISVAEGDLIRMVYYTSDSADMIASGSATNGWQTYLTVEEL